MSQPNPVVVAFGIVRTILKTGRPAPSGSAGVDHSDLKPVLEALAAGGLAAAMAERVALGSYLSAMSDTRPDLLSRDEALAFWLNLYNAAAVRLASRALDEGEDSVLRVRGGFTQPVVTIAGERLSLDAIEHGKIRRFADPRIHGALVCGSLSCPTLRQTPFSGSDLDSELDDQMRFFLANGGAVLTGGRLELSRIFLWYGPDFVRPSRMPSFLPVSRRRVVEALSPWLPGGINAGVSIVFQEYDWGLACQVG